MCSSSPPYNLKYLCGFGGEPQCPRLHAEGHLHVIEPSGGNTQRSSSVLPAVCSDAVRHTDVIELV